MVADHFLESPVQLRNSTMAVHQLTVTFFRHQISAEINLGGGLP